MLTKLKTKSLRNALIGRRYRMIEKMLLESKVYIHFVIAKSRVPIAYVVVTCFSASIYIASLCQVAD